MNRLLTLVLCAALLLSVVSFSPQHLVAGDNESESEPEINEVVIYGKIIEIKESENVLVVVERADLDDQNTDAETLPKLPGSEQNDEKNAPQDKLNFKLINYQKASNYKVGWMVEAICSCVKPEGDNQIEYFDCDVVPLDDIEQDVVLDGIVYKIDQDLKFCVVGQDLVYYRVEFEKGQDLHELSPGRLVAVFGKSLINRPYLIYDASFETKEDKQATRTLRNCIVPPQGWHDRLFRVKSNNEFWQVNFEDGQPNTHLKDHMIFGIKGVKDNHLEQTLHNCVLLDYLTDQSITGTIVEMLPGHGILKIQDTKERIITLNSEMTFSNLLDFEIGETVRIIGYKQELRYDLPVLFTKMSRIDSSKLQPVNFVGEFISYSDANKKDTVIIRSGSINWLVSVPSGFNRYSIRPNDWVKVIGQIDSYLNHTIRATSVTKSKAEVFAEIINSDYSKNEVKVFELSTRASWLVTPKKGRRAKYPNSTKVRVLGSTHEYRDNYLEDAIVTKLINDSGVVVFVDSYNQKLTIKREDETKFQLEIRTDWNNINEFAVGMELEIHGHRTKDGYNSPIIKKTN